MEQSKHCILAVDTSGSVSGSKLYWDNTEKLLDELEKKSCNLSIIVWNTAVRKISITALRQFIIQRRDPHTGCTNPDRIWHFLTDNNRSNKFDLYITTDGEIGSDRYNAYIELYNNMPNKPDDINMYYWGVLSQMNMQFLDCFTNVKYTINGIDTNRVLVAYTSNKLAASHLFKYLCDLDEYKMLNEHRTDDLCGTLESLHKVLYRKFIEYSENERNGDVGVEFKKFVDRVNGLVHRKYMDVNTKADADNFEQLFNDYNANSKQIFGHFVQRVQNVTSADYRQVLSRIVELGNGRTTVDRRLMAYGENWHERIKNDMMTNNNIVLSNDDSDADDSDADDSDTDANSDNDDYETVQVSKVGFVTKETEDAFKCKVANSQCPIMLLDSHEYDKFCVAWIGIDHKFGGNNLQQLIDTELRRKLAKNTISLFKFLPAEKVNARIPPANQHVSVDAFLGLERIKINQVGDKRYRRVYQSPLHTVSCFGLILYNADSDKFESATMTENEMNIFLHNYSTVTQILFGNSKFAGSFPLLYVFFLYILYQCERLDDYTKMCIKMTIERSSEILKCPFMIESGLEPSFYSSIKNAFLFHTAIFPNEIDLMDRQIAGINISNALNIPRRNISSSHHLLSLSRDAFNVHYKQEYKYKLKLWTFWNYMCRCQLPTTQKLLHFKQIAITKFQNWERMEDEKVKIMLVEGTSDKPYLEYLENVDYEDIVKLIVLFEQLQSPKLLQDMSGLPTMKLAERNEWYNVKLIEKIKDMSCNMDDVPFCKTLCGYPNICPFSNLPRLECYENQKFDLRDFGYTDNNSTKFAHSYVQKCKNLILKKTGDAALMVIPSIDEIKEYVVKNSPWAVYHVDFDRIVGIIINKYSTWNDWYLNADENEKKNYLGDKHFLDWKKVFNSHS